MLASIAGISGTVQKRLIGIICIAVLCVILNLGLWPCHAPKNEVAWLKARNGLRFGDYGTVMSTRALDGTGSRDTESCSVEIWLQAALTDSSGTIVSFYAPNHPARFSVHQSLGDLMVQSGAATWQRLNVDDVFRQVQPVFVTITSGMQGTAVYVNGTLVKAARQLRLTAGDCTGRLILGDSPLQQDTWSGELMGLAIYRSELAAPAVLVHYNAWMKKGRPEAAQKENNVALYLFDERAGNVVHNHAGLSLDLAIPDTYTVLDKILLEPFWQEFGMSWGYWKGVLKNVVGFIPLGFCFYAYFSLICHCRRAAPMTVIFGTTVSLTIEVLQGYLPTRQSGTTDLITNTLGTWIGVLSYRTVIPELAEMLPWLVSAAPPRR